MILHATDILGSEKKAKNIKTENKNEKERQKSKQTKQKKKKTKQKPKAKKKKKIAVKLTLLKKQTVKRECPLRPSGTWHMTKNRISSYAYGMVRNVGLFFSFKY